MSTVEIYKYTDINCSDIKIDKPDKKGTYYYGLVKYNKQNNLFVHLNNVKYKKYELSDIPTINIDIDDVFKEFLTRLDEHMIQLIQNNIDHDRYYSWPTDSDFRRFAEKRRLI